MLAQQWLKIVIFVMLGIILCDGSMMDHKASLSHKEFIIHVG